METQSNTTVQNTDSSQMDQNVVIEWVESMDSVDDNIIENNNVLLLDSIPIIHEQQGVQVIHEHEAINYNENEDAKLQEEMETTPAVTPTSELRRKRKVNKNLWKSSIRKQNYQSGKQYVSRRGKVVPAKEIVNKKDCLNSCKFKCAKLITEDERKEIFNSYYALCQNEKLHFLLKTTERKLTKRSKPKPSRRSFTFGYFFDVRDHRFPVCKNYYLGTLNISQKPIYNVHKNKNEISNVANNSLRGKGVGRKLPERDRNIVMDHINKFPRIASHYCRADTKKVYLDPNLNIKKMYQLYVEECNEDLNIPPVKESMYRGIFCTEFNLEFHKPKKDLCLICEQNNTDIRQNRKIDSETADKVEKHKEQKMRMREERDNDKKGDIPVLCFDLENVITLPITNIGNFFYLPKLTCYNLTGHFSKTKKVYNALWTEYTGGRSGNDIASAITQILERVVSENDGIEDIITWSDSCVPQNRNSMMSYAILTFLKNHPSIKSITMKYSVPGHLAIQQVDNAHGQIEMKLRTNDIFSPLGLIRVLKTVNPKFQFIQVQPQQFLNFGEASKGLVYKEIPYTKVSVIRYTQNHSVVEYKTNFVSDYVKVCIKPKKRSTRLGISAFDRLYPEPKIIKKSTGISTEKAAALITMMTVMPEQDKAYYNTILKTS